MLNRLVVLSLLISTFGTTQSANWARIKPKVCPPKTKVHSLAFCWGPTFQEGPMPLLWTGLSYGFKFWKWSGDWEPIKQNTTPPWRGCASLCNSGSSVVLFGGKGSAIYSDTWIYRIASGWTKENPALAPPARYNHAMAKGATGIILFGGLDSTKKILGDSWTWDGRIWKKQLPATSPPGLMGHMMTYDPSSKGVLLFGGKSPNGWSNETWLWNGSVWKNLNPKHSPPPRAFFSMALGDSQRIGNKPPIIVYGGLSSKGKHLNDTWEWDGKDWHNITGPNSPPSLISPQICFSQGPYFRDNFVLLFGGESNNHVGPQQETWIMKRAGGLGSVQKIGASCAKPQYFELNYCYAFLSNKLNTLFPRRPTIGLPIGVFLGQLNMTYFPPGSKIYISFGYTKSHHGPISLPFDLGPLGAPNCFLYSEIAHLFPARVSGLGHLANIYWYSFIPDSPVLIGKKFYMQGFYPNLNHNPLGVVTTNGLEITLGNQ